MFQQPGELGGGLLTALQEGIALFQPLGQLVGLLGELLQGLFLAFHLVPSGGCLLPGGFSPEQLFSPLGKLGALLGQGHRLLPQGLGLATLLFPLGGGPLQLVTGCLVLLKSCQGLLIGFFQPGIGFRCLKQPFRLFQFFGASSALGPEAFLSLGQGGGFFLQSLGGVAALLLQQGGPQGGGLLPLVLQSPFPLVEAVCHFPPHPGGEQGLQHFPLVLGVGPQQPQEIPLGQHDHLGELLAG